MRAITVKASALIGCLVEDVNGGGIRNFCVITDVIEDSRDVYYLYGNWQLTKEDAEKVYKNPPLFSNVKSCKRTPPCLIRVLKSV